jgi:hypothetical protein
MHLPEPLLARALMRRGLVMWIVVRVAFFIVGSIAAMLLGPPTVRLASGTVVVLVALCALLGVLDVLRRRERTLLANLGVSLPQLVLLLVIPAALGELAIALVVAG